MRISIYQPRYFPQLHYFNRMIDSDVFVLLDTAQYTKSLTQAVDGVKKREHSYQSDTPLKSPQGIILLTVPVRHDSYQMINRVRIDYSQPWQKKHLSVLRNAYGRTENFRRLYPFIEQLLSFRYKTLADLNRTTLLWPLSYLLGKPLDPRDCTVGAINRLLREKLPGFRLRQVIPNSLLGVERPEGLHRGTEWTVAICDRLQATEYFHGATALSAYMDPDLYRAHGITTVLQQWHCVPYPQATLPLTAFAPNLSILDLLLNVPLIHAREVIGIRPETGMNRRYVCVQ